MHAFLLATNFEEPIANKWEAFLFGGGVFLRGMLTVFAVLCIIWFFLFLVRLLIEKMNGAVENRVQEAPAPAPVAVAAEPVAPATDDGELIAVIAAAIAAAEAETGRSGFRVVSFHRVNK